MAISKGRALSATVNSATSIIKSSIDGTATIATLEQSAQQYANADALPSVGNTFGEMALVQSTNRMYVWNGSGWYNVALINTNPTFTTSPDTNYTFDGDSPRSNITIAVAASDPESLGVSFTFETGGSMDSMASVTQDSSIFTLVPRGNDSLTEGASLTGSLIIKASDGVNIVPVVSQFTLTFVLTIEGSSGNRLLLKTKTNGALTTAQKSLTFDGTGDYLTSSSVDTAGTGEFTAEAFFYANALPSVGCIMAQRAATPSTNNYAQWLVYVQSNGNLAWYNGVSGQRVVETGAGGIVAKRWYHVAITRNSSNVATMWLDGVSVGTRSHTSNWNYAPFTVGANGDGSEAFNGFISNVRWIVGTALYTSNFTVPSSPLTAVTNTKFLVAQGSTTDNSGQNETVSTSGDVAVSNFSPFHSGGNQSPVDSSTSNHSLTMAGATASLGTFSPYRHGGYSHYFDGSGDYLRDDTIADAFDSNGHCDNFTIEMWVWNNDSTSDSNYVIGSNAVSSGANDFLLGTRKVYWNAAELADYGNDRTNQYEWFHLVCVHEHDPTGPNNETVSVWINGRRTGRHTGLARISFANNTWAFGTEADAGSFGTLGNYHNGYIYDVKITKAALYGDTPIIPVPTEMSTPHPTANIFHGFQKGFIDPRFTIGGNVSIDEWTPLDYSGLKEENGGSASFPGTSDEIKTSDASTNQVVLGSGDFTVECWIYKNNAASSFWEALISQNYTATGGWRFYKTDGSGRLRWYAGSTDTLLSDASNPIRQNCWSHAAIVRSSGTLTWYINGKASGTVSSHTYNYTGGTNGEIEIGKGTVASALPTDAHMTDVRIVAGTAVYTGDFTPPSAPLTTTGGTYPSDTNVNTSIPSGHTKLLLNMTQAKIVDKSQSRNIPITGNVIASSEQQHYGENTLAFDGNGDRIKIERVIPLGDDIDWTIETWVRSPSAEGSRVDLISQYEASPAAGRMGIYFLNKKLAFFQSNLSPTLAQGTTDVVNNQWHHVAVTNHVGTRRIYLDGNFEGSTSGTGHMLDTDTVIGDLGDGLSNGAELNGHLHDLRITQGLVRYPYIAKPKILSQTNSNMEKPGGTFPSVSNASNTIFLGCHANTIVDGSATGATITVSGNAQVSSFVPPGHEIGMKSVHFDGSSDYLSSTLPSVPGTGDWTVEYWVWHDETGGGNQIHLSFGAYAPAFYYRNSSSENRFTLYQQSAGLSGNVFMTISPTPNKWYHLAWVHDDSTGKLGLFVNGAFYGDTTYSGNISSTSLRVGDDTTGAWMNGNISNLRIVKEKLYTHNFTPSTTAIVA